jgi:hypothetical protein
MSEIDATATIRKPDLANRREVLGILEEQAREIVEAQKFETG